MRLTAQRWAAPLVDRCAFHLLMALRVWEWLLQELYERSAVAQTQVAMAAAFWLLGTGLLALASRTGPAPHGPHRSRLFVLLAFAACFCDRIWGHSDSLAALAWLAVMGTVLMAWRWSARQATATWAAARTAMVVASALFVLSPQMWAFGRGPAVTWPLAGPPSPGPAAPRVATLVVLFDELNARSAGPLIDVLQRHRLKTRMLSVQAVSDSTLKVIPELFAHRSYAQAKPCTLTALCSGPDVFDFAAVHAASPDVDVVGFFHPYCAIQGLRTCYRGTMDGRILQADLWACAWWRHVGWPAPADPLACDRAQARAWELMRTDMLLALQRAPVWEQGGLLFAHLPLPHPPGATPGAPLSAHYAENIARAAAVLEQMVARIEAQPGMELRLVVFSDHPLRPRLWCDSYWPYASRGCEDTRRLDDDTVPLIVASRSGVSMPAVDNNGQVFEMLQRIRWDGAGAPSDPQAPSAP